MDEFEKFTTGLDSPASRAFAVSPHNTSELPVSSRGLFVGTGGAVAVILVGDDVAVTFKNVPSGSLLRVRARIVRAAATTADDIVALY